MSQDRILALDGLRGFALLGILFGNLSWFTGYAVLRPEARAALPTADLDGATTWAIHCFVDGKFYGIFSLLFGVGFGILAQRVQGRMLASLFLRRMALLFLIGIAHATLLWFGDIVSLYAVFGSALLLFRRVSQRGLMLAAGILLVAPVILATIWMKLSIAPPPYGPNELLVAFGNGSYREVLNANWAFLEGRWLQAAYSGRPCKLLALFLLGFWATRHGIALAPQRFTEQLRRYLQGGLLLGLPANLALATIHSQAATPALVVLQALVEAVAVPSLTIAYSAGIFLLFGHERSRAWLAWLAKPGRMSLTLYLMQSLVGTLLFYGYGLGYWGRIGAVWIAPLALTIFLGQSFFSSCWLGRFRQGPLEWLWRRAALRIHVPRSWG